VRQVSDPTANITFAQTYEPFGDVLTTSGTDSSIYGYTNEYTDATGLLYLRARYLNTGIGRFITRDTWGGDYQRPLSLNKWNYVEGNPINYTDPSGHCLDPVTFILCVTIGGGIIGGVTAISWDVFVIQERGVQNLDNLFAAPLSEASKRLNPFDPNFRSQYCGVDWVEAALFGGLGAAIGTLTSHFAAKKVVDIYEYFDDYQNQYDPYNIAKDGGKHSGFYDNYVDRTDQELLKSIESFEKNVIEHEQKISEPYDVAPDWDAWDERKQIGQIKQWIQHRDKSQEQIEILQGILKERGIIP